MICVWRSSFEFFFLVGLLVWQTIFRPRRSAVWPLGIPWPLQGTGLLRILGVSLRIYRTWRMCRMFHVSALILTGSESCVCCARDFGGSACYRCILLAAVGSSYGSLKLHLTEDVLCGEWKQLFEFPRFLLLEHALIRCSWLFSLRKPIYVLPLLQNHSTRCILLRNCAAFARTILTAVLNVALSNFPLYRISEIALLLNSMALLYLVFQAVAYMHGKGIMHRAESWVSTFSKKQ